MFKWLLISKFFHNKFFLKLKHEIDFGPRPWWMHFITGIINLCLWSSKCFQLRFVRKVTTLLTFDCKKPTHRKASGAHAAALVIGLLSIGLLCEGKAVPPPADFCSPCCYTTDTEIKPLDNSWLSHHFLFVFLFFIRHSNTPITKRLSPIGSL